MRIGYYLSNLLPAWSIGRQTECFADQAPMPLESHLFCDDLPLSAIRDRRAPRLPGRLEMLGQQIGRVRVASIGVLACSKDDLVHVLMHCKIHRITVEAIAETLSIPPGAGREDIGHVLDAFRAARRADRSGGKAAPMGAPSVAPAAGGAPL